MKLLLIKENCLPPEKCQELIGHYQTNTEKTYQWRDTFPLSLKDIREPWLHVHMRNMVTLCKILSPKPIYLDNQEVVKWPTGSFQTPHYDNEGDAIGSVTYLNEDFVGGCTNFRFNKETLRISPEIGKTLFFTGTECEHFVEKVESGTRYTLAFWTKYVRNIA